ncbi:MAG: XRE family transcriptional regulator [Deltaproteobacteria bacterium RIFCSPLOWO2_02_FULL_53_8]|nr:MAG: XRE family transcriptional regulator [Deltaproteobacteria bacterium RIFCSPLOWO2_02_FULL_53_8]
MNKQACFCCGAPEGMIRFKDRTFEVTYQQLKRNVPGLAGWECVECAEVEFDADSAISYAKAGDQLIEDAKQAVADEMKRIRKKLHRTQRQMVALSGGGHNAFSRYERAEVEPPQPLIVLMAILDRHPELLGQIEEIFSEGGDVGIKHLVAKKEKARLAC